NSENAVANGNGVADGNVHKPVVGVVANDIVVRRLPADDAAERDRTVPDAGLIAFGARNAPGGGRLRQHLPDLKRARPRVAVDRRALGRQHGFRAGDELIADRIVEAALDDEHARRIIQQRAAGFEMRAVRADRHGYPNLRVPTMRNPKPSRPTYTCAGEFDKS